jgi:uncharacterized protein (UPF0371 family)
MTHIPTPGDDAGLRKLGINLTADPTIRSKSLFIASRTRYAGERRDP